MNYIVGRELQKGEYVVNLSNNLSLNLCVLSPWTLMNGLPNSLRTSRVDIRSFNSKQLETVADQDGRQSTYYCFYYSSIDMITPTAEKN